MKRAKKRFLDYSRQIADILLYHYLNEGHTFHHYCAELEIPREKFFRMLGGTYNFKALEIVKIGEMTDKYFFFKQGEVNENNH